MSAEKGSSREARVRMTRRGVLTVGGLTLVAGYLLDPAKQVIETARARETHETSTHLVKAEPTAPSSGARQGTPSSPMFHIDDGPKAIALTIDDGPSPVYTPQVLRLLEKYRITATFSMIGIQAQAYPAVAREVAEAGHLIANHTWTHR